MPPCLTLSIMRYGSRVKWINSGKGVAPSPTSWCSSNRKGSLLVTLDNVRQLYLLTKCCILTCIYIYIYTCIYMQNGSQRHNNKGRGKTSLEKYAPLTLLKGFEKGYSGFYSERELKTEQNCNILTPTLMAVSVVSFSFSWAAQPEAQFSAG